MKIHSIASYNWHHLICFSEVRCWWCHHEHCTSEKTAEAFWTAVNAAMTIGIRQSDGISGKREAKYRDMAGTLYPSLRLIMHSVASLTFSADAGGVCDLISNESPEFTNAAVTIGVLSVDDDRDWAAEENGVGVLLGWRSDGWCLLMCLAIFLLVTTIPQCSQNLLRSDIPTFVYDFVQHPITAMTINVT